MKTKRINPVIAEHFAKLAKTKPMSLEMARRFAERDGYVLIAGQCYHYYI